MARPATATAPRRRFPLDHPLLWLLLLAAAHVAVRVTVAPALKWDESEQILWSQQLALGYADSAQPPLYTWLQWGLVQLLGPGVLALAVLKHGLLALTYVFMWLAARELLDERGAWWASASLMLLPAMGWFSIREHTHTVLVTALACGAWWLLLRLARRPSTAHFAWLGVVCGLGLLAKYSFALVVACMLLAALSVPQVRRPLLARGWGWAPGAAMAVVLPHAAWLASRLQQASAATIAKLELVPGERLALGVPRLLASVAGSLVLFALLALAVFGSAWWRGPRAPAAAWAQRVFTRYLVLIGLALLGLVLIAGATQFKSRWLLPMLCVVPLAAFAARPRLQAHPRGRAYTLALVALALLILAASAARPWLNRLQGQPGESNQPVIELAAALQQAGYDGRGLIAATDPILAATLRTRFPRAPAQACSDRFDVRLDVAACLAAAQARARAAGLGVLLISRDGPQAADTARPLAVLVPGAAVRSLDLPLRDMPAGTPAAHYEFIWQPPAAPAPAPGAASLAQGRRDVACSGDVDKDGRGT